MTGDNEVGAITWATVEAVGLSAGDGINLIANDSELTVAADSTAYTFAYASGASVSFDGDGLTRAESHADATATGIRAADGDNMIANTEQVTVRADATTAKRLETSITVYNTGDDEQPTDPPQTYDEEELPAFVNEDGDSINQSRTDYRKDHPLWTGRRRMSRTQAVPRGRLHCRRHRVAPDGPDGRGKTLRTMAVGAHPAGRSRHGHHCRRPLPVIRTTAYGNGRDW